MLITDTQILRTFGDHATVERGRAYFRQGRARILSHSCEGDAHVIESEVRGGQPEPYRQTSRLRLRAGGAVDLDSDCTCPMSFDCKHVAAALFAWRETAADPFAMPPEVEQWIAQIEDIVRRAGETFAPEQRQRAFYVLGLEDGGVTVRPLSVRLDKHGLPSGRPTLIDAGQAASQRSPAKYLRASDLAVLGKIAYDRRWGSDDYKLQGEESGRALGAMIDSGRCHWGALDGPVLRRGDERRARGVWTSDSDGRQRFALEPEMRGDAVLAVRPPWYLDLEAGLAGPLASDLPPVLADAFLGAPAVPRQVAGDVAERLAAALATPALQAPLPRSDEAVKTLKPAPRPLARLALEKVRRLTPGRNSWSRHGVDVIELPVLKAAFDYAGQRFELADPRRGAQVGDEATQRVLRDPEAEKRWLGRLETLRLRRLETLHPLLPEEPQRKWLSFGAGCAPNDFAGLLVGPDGLEAAGWSVEIQPGFELALARADEDSWTFEIAPAEENRTDWFDLALGVRIDGQRLDILPIVCALIARLPGDEPIEALKAEAARGRRDMAVPLSDGRLLLVQLERLIPIVEGLLQVWAPGEIGEAGSRISRFEAESFGALQDAAGQAAAWSGDSTLARLAEAFRGWRDRTPTPLPEGFAAALRPYQQTGLDWMQLLGRAGFGGVLADEMGLGKTVQALAHIAQEKAVGRLDRPALVVAPTSVLPNWRAEAERFAPQLKTLVLTGPGRVAEFANIPASDLVITSYPLLARDRDTLLTHAYSLAVLDEGQIIRNPATAAAQAAYALDARQRLVLSGTPMENHLGDVWSLTHFTNPGLLGDAKAFGRRFRQPIEKRGDEAARARLARRLRPFMLRRTIAEVAGELPSKSEIEERIVLTPAQADLYESTRLVMDKRVRDALAKRGLAQSSIIVLDALLKLRQVCCDPRLVRNASASAKAGGSAKLARLVELLEELCAEERPVIVFSQFTSMLGLIGSELTARRLDYVWLTGDTHDRETPVRRFQSGEVGVFLISLKAGGMGLNLTRAETVILYDPWWNPAVEAQAIGRAHRIGQQRPVFAYRLIAIGTIEEKMLQLQDRKRELASGLWSQDAATLGALTEDDIRQLFA